MQWIARNLQSRWPSDDLLRADTRWALGFNSNLEKLWRFLFQPEWHSCLPGQMSGSSPMETIMAQRRRTEKQICASKVRLHTDYLYRYRQRDSNCLGQSFRKEHGVGNPQHSGTWAERQWTEYRMTTTNVIGAIKYEKHLHNDPAAQHQLFWWKNGAQYDRHYMTLMIRCIKRSSRLWFRQYFPFV